MIKMSIFVTAGLILTTANAAPAISSNSSSLDTQIRDYKLTQLQHEINGKEEEIFDTKVAALASAVASGVLLFKRRPYLASFAGVVVVYSYNELRRLTKQLDALKERKGRVQEGKIEYRR